MHICTGFGDFGDGKRTLKNSGKNALLPLANITYYFWDNQLFPKTSEFFFYCQFNFLVAYFEL